MNNLTGNLTVANGNLNEPDDFEQFLDGLGNAEELERQRMQAELNENYAVWTDCFNLLKDQFGRTWELFKGIEEKLPGWYWGSSSYGQWDFMGASGYGYNFGVGIYFCGDNDPGYRGGEVFRAKKYLSITFGNHGLPNGIGDERNLGRVSDLDDTLVGLENCTGRVLSHQLSGSKYMLDKLGKQKLTFVLHNPSIGHGGHAEGLEFLRHADMRYVAQQLFKALNSDMEIELPKYIASSVSR